MPFLNKVGGGSARKFGLSRRVQFYVCSTNTGITSLNPADNKCYYPANYGASSSQQQQGPACYSGGGTWGSNPGAGCCSCSACPYANCAGCFDVSCQCYNTSWQPIGNSSGSCYQPYYINTTVYSCPQNTSVATLSSTTCVYPATYNATLSG